MENASKALIMAASVILGVILMATLIYMLRLGGSINKTYDETQISYQTEAFNYQFEVYQRDDNTIMDMVTLLNLAYSVNEENEYDMNDSIVIVLNIGNKKYQIPKCLPNEASNASDYFNQNNKSLERNQVYNATDKKVISVYDLINKTFNDGSDDEKLGISGSFITATDKLSKIHIGDYYYYPDGSSTPKKADGGVGTTYKYIFDCNDEKITYNDSTGKISRMEFTCRKNDLWDCDYGDSDSNEIWD